jgi:flagellar assembly protein FliH
MEYRQAGAIAPVLVEPKPLFAVPDMDVRPLNGTKEDREQLKARVEELEQQLQQREQEFEQKLELARTAAFEDGRKAEASLRAAAVEKIAGQMGHTLEEFRAARDGYLAQVEQEVVQLALAIAERVLRREAQMDPLLLAGAVRVALGQISETTEVRMKVPAAEYELWNEMISLMPSLPLRPQLIADESLRAGDCSLETAMGSVDLGVKSQLAEIERGFFDLLEHRERAAENVGKTQR